MKNFDIGECFAGITLTALFSWVVGSCCAIAFNGFAGDFNAIRIFMEVMTK